MIVIMSTIDITQFKQQKDKRQFIASSQEFFDLNSALSQKSCIEYINNIYSMYKTYRNDPIQINILINKYFYGMFPDIGNVIKLNNWKNTMEMPNKAINNKELNALFNQITNNNFKENPYISIWIGKKKR